MVARDHPIVLGFGKCPNLDQSWGYFSKRRNPNLNLLFVAMLDVLLLLLLYVLSR